MTVQKERGAVAVGLDVGTTKICAIVGKRERGKTEILAVGSAPSSGLRKGVVVDMFATVDSIRKAVLDASEKMGRSIDAAYVGIAGGHIKGFHGSGAVVTRDGIVREEDVERLIDSAGAVYVPVEREVLHVIPSGFRLDGLNGIKDPLGMEGTRLEGAVHIVTGSVTSVQNLVTCCRKAGVTALDILLEPLASAESVLTERERERGVILVDIGGGTTDMALYQEGLLRHTAVLSVGGNHITNDISVTLGITAPEAETVKKRFGYAVRNGLYAEEHAPDEIAVSAEGSHARKIRLDYLSEIIQARCQELLVLVRGEVEASSTEFDRLSVVLTGGTSLLKGIRELAEEIFSLPVRIGVPGGVIDKGIVHSPVYATGVGLVQYGLRQYADADLGPVPVLERMKKWVSGFSLHTWKERRTVCSKSMT